MKTLIHEYIFEDDGGIETKKAVRRARRYFPNLLEITRSKTIRFRKGLGKSIKFSYLQLDIENGAKVDEYKKNILSFRNFDMMVVNFCQFAIQHINFKYVDRRILIDGELPSYILSRVRSINLRGVIGEDISLNKNMYYVGVSSLDQFEYVVNIGEVSIETLNINAFYRDTNLDKLPIKVNVLKIVAMGQESMTFDKFCAVVKKIKPKRIDFGLGLSNEQFVGILPLLVPITLSTNMMLNICIRVTNLSIINSDVFKNVRINALCLHFYILKSSKNHLVVDLEKIPPCNVFIIKCIYFHEVCENNILLNGFTDKCKTIFIECYENHYVSCSDERTRSLVRYSSIECHYSVNITL